MKHDYVAVTASRSDDTFVYAAAAPMSIPLDTDAPNGLVVPLLILADSVSNESETVSTTVTAVPVTAAAEVLRMEFYHFIPVTTLINGRFRIRVPWEITAVGNAGSVGRISVNILRRRGGVISVLPSVNAYNGRFRALDALGRFNENDLIVQVPGGAGRFVEGDDLVLRVSFNVTTAQAGAAAATVRFYHNPTVTNDRMVCEADWP